MKISFTILFTVLLVGFLFRQFNSTSDTMFGKLLSIFGDSQTPEEKFWNWFDTNRERVQSSLYISKDKINDALIEEIGKKVKGYNKAISWEMGQAQDGVWELILGCDGIKEGIPQVEKLVNSAPKLPNWRILKYRQPRPIENTNRIAYEGLSINPDEIMVYFEKNDETSKFDIAVFFKHYSETDKRYMSCGFLYLDEILGEYNVMTKVGSIEFLELTESIDKSKLLSLAEFQKAFNK